MYTGHFGLDDGPFHGKAEGQDVYLGPRQAAVVSRLRKVLGISDTAVTVSGPVGVGKTTLVRRAIADVPGMKIVISVDRIRLEPDEVLDLLLSRFDVSRPPKGTIQRVAAFRRLLQERLSNDTRVFLVVEDAERVGVDALLELEALTAIDGGEPVGANIVLMGSGELPALLARPALARLRQRIRLRQEVAPFEAAEVEGYMRHCLEVAGGVLEQIFEPGTTDIVYRYSDGIARVIDNLCESALVAAAEAELATILPEFLQEVAENCGLDPQVPGPDASGGDAAECAPSVERVDADPVVGQAPTDEDRAPLVAAPGPPKLALVEKPSLPADPESCGEAPDGGHEPEPDALADTSLPVVVASEDGDGDATAEAPSPVDEWQARSASLSVSRIDEVLPELLERLRSSAQRRGRAAPTLSPPAQRETDDNDIPTLSSSMRVAVLPVRRLDERPLTAVDDVDAEGPEPAVADAEGAELIEADVTDERPELVTAAVVDAAGGEPVEAAVVDDEGPELVAAAVVDDLLSDDAATAVPAGEAPPVEVPAGDVLHDPLRPEGVAEVTAEKDRPGADTGTFDSSRAAGDEPFSFATLVPEMPDDEVTTEAATLPAADEPALEPEVATDVFVAESAADDHAGEPELDALQAAIQAANAWQASESGKEEAASASKPSTGGQADLPEITLDVELEKQKPAANDLDRWVEELGKAKGLEDISEILAETIFGNEDVEAISAEIRARKAAERTGAGPGAPPAKAAPATAPSAPQPAPAKAAPARPAAGPHKPAGKAPASPPSAGALNMTMSQRIAMVNSLKGRKTSPPPRPMRGMPVAEIVLAERPDEPLPGMVGKAPAPIEAQIDTAITQSRKALTEADLARMADHDGGDDDDDDDDKKGSRGLFGFFRRSSKN